MASLTLKSFRNQFQKLEREYEELLGQNESLRMENRRMDDGIEKLNLGMPRMLREMEQLDQEKNELLRRCFPLEKEVYHLRLELNLQETRLQEQERTFQTLVAQSEESRGVLENTILENRRKRNEGMVYFRNDGLRKEVKNMEDEINVLQARKTELHAKLQVLYNAALLHDKEIETLNQKVNKKTQNLQYLQTKENECKQINQEMSKQHDILLAEVTKLTNQLQSEYNVNEIHDI